MAVQVERWLFTVDEFHRMAEVGLLAEDDRVELIDGEIIRMTPIGDEHAGEVNRLNRVFGPLNGARAVLSVQNPVRLGHRVEPQPDLSLLVPRDDDYARSTPTAPDILLVIEVSDTSLEYDRQVKAPLYARAGIREYWIVNLIDREVSVYREPGPEGYQNVQVLRPGDTLQPLAFRDLQIPVSEVLIA